MNQRDLDKIIHFKTFLLIVSAYEEAHGIWPEEPMEDLLDTISIYLRDSGLSQEEYPAELRFLAELLERSAQRLEQDTAPLPYKLTGPGM